jgi:hypothetical protein
MWRMECEGLVIGVPRCGRLKPTNVGTMAKFSLSIATDDLIVRSRLEELLLLLRCTLFPNSNLFC